ncbi:hypothetical protein SLEP1_g21913 [Rubroshorea leprosula]|uniref:Uncharacterized protein n=1 Tax=Rubroshorea leprosula TaxID=152421 RepID=A0AAV5J7J6_9ROSI|nr:hypothetical protein SLEP1_g21913 [Rubroshorea leprosula]
MPSSGQTIPSASTVLVLVSSSGSSVENLVVPSCSSSALSPFLVKESSPAVRRHPMVTRSQDGTRRVHTLPSLLSIAVPIQEPKSFSHAVCSLEWCTAMVKEYSTLLSMFLNQSKYILELLERAGIKDCQVVATPLDSKKKLAATDSLPYFNLSGYRSIVGALQYATFTRWDIAFAVQQKQSTVSHSSAEAEYCALANAVAKATWVHQLLSELSLFLSSPTTVYCDNISALHMSSNPVQHHRTNHIEIDLHFVWEKVASQLVQLHHVPTCHQWADILTKALPIQQFSSLRTNLSILSHIAQSEGG